MIEDLVFWIPLIITGAIAGWLGSLLFKGKGNGLILNIILGIAGAFVGTELFELLDIEISTIWVRLLSAIIGAFVILWFFRLVFGSR